MDLPAPNFVVVEAQQLVALAGNFTMDNRHEIPNLWNKFFSQNWDIEGEQVPASYGASYSAKPDGSFSYAVGVQIKPFPHVLPEGACEVTLSGGRYAVFALKGPVSDIPSVFDAIFNQWLPNADVSMREGAVFEYYPYDGGTPDNMTYEIWVPVVE